MLSTYQQLAQAIHEGVPDINWLDIDKGQLENPEAFNSLIVPAVLIGQAEIEWTDLLTHNQQGVGNIVISTVFRLPGQTHLLDPLLAQHLKTLELADDVDRVARQFRGVVSRTRSRDYVAGPFFVTEQTYEGAFKRGPFLRAVTAKPFITPSIHNPIAEA